MKTILYKHHKKPSKFSRVCVAQRHVLFYHSTKTSPWIARLIVWHVFFVNRVVSSSILSWGFLGFLIDFFFSNVNLVMNFPQSSSALRRSQSLYLTYNEFRWFFVSFQSGTVWVQRPHNLGAQTPLSVEIISFTDRVPGALSPGTVKGEEGIRLCK